jgi:hypothetical protein
MRNAAGIGKGQENVSLEERRPARNADPDDSEPARRSALERLALYVTLGAREICCAQDLARLPLGFRRAPDGCLDLSDTHDVRTSGCAYNHFSG